jgi:hypothetical protein
MKTSIVSFLTIIVLSACSLAAPSIDEAAGDETPGDQTATGSFLYNGDTYLTTLPYTSWDRE